MFCTLEGAFNAPQLLRTLDVETYDRNLADAVALLRAHYRHELKRNRINFTTDSPENPAPATLHALRQSVIHLIGGERVFTVSREHSDRSVYGDAETNWEFRAVHDAMHLAIDAEMNAEGEARVNLRHRSAFESFLAGEYRNFVNVPKRSPEIDATARAILDAETYGHCAFFRAFGFFPKEQARFARAWATTNAESARAFAALEGGAA